LEEPPVDREGAVNCQGACVGLAEGRCYNLLSLF
jgi:hypothetical protein